MQPSFGYFIRSPEEREPFALLKPDVSRSNLEKEVTHLHQGLFSGSGLNERFEGTVILTHNHVNHVIIVWMKMYALLVTFQHKRFV